MRTSLRSAAAALRAAASVLRASSGRNTESYRKLRSLLPELLRRVQKRYDDWDEEDVDTYAGGGICHFLADDMVDVISDKTDFAASTVSASHEVHVYTVVQTPDGVYLVDIPPYCYEHGGGYSWTKVHDVTFDASDVIIDPLDPDPANMWEYVEEWDKHDDPYWLKRNGDDD